MSVEAAESRGFSGRLTRQMYYARFIDSFEIYLGVSLMHVRLGIESL